MLSVIFYSRLHNHMVKIRFSCYFLYLHAVHSLTKAKLKFCIELIDCLEKMRFKNDTEN